MILSPDEKRKLPKIAIIGRPNVGKSTLFNRMVKSRRAITDPTPGVTRDSVESPILLEGRSFLLIDTGGYNTELEEFNVLVAEKALKAAADADLILLLIDVENMDGNDLTFIEKMRIYSNKLFLIVNKVDTVEREALVWEYYSLGFREVMHLSSAHGRNMDELYEKILEYFEHYEYIAKEEDQAPVKIAIMGKPNTGKSTLANYLIGENKSIVSDIPGTTRDVVEGGFFYNNRLFRILDTAGIRRKKKVINQVEYYSVNRAIATIKESHIIYLLIDSEEGVTDQDKKIASLAVERGRGIVLVLSKWDLQEEIPNMIQAMTDRIRYFFPIMEFAPVVPLSGETGYGVKKLLNVTIEMEEQLIKRVETGRLNTQLQKWVDSYPLRSKGKPIKILYMTQVSANPVKFVLFVSRIKGFRKEYVNYLKNRIKDDLGFKLIPFTLDLREKSGHERKPT